MTTYIANSLFVLFVLFCVSLLILHIINRDKKNIDLTGQSERQENNDDYNNDYFI